MRARSQRRANDRAKIVRIFDAVKQHNQSRVDSFLVRVRKNIFKRACRARSANRHNSLVIACACSAVELPTLFKADGDSVASGKLHDFFRACVLPSFRHEHVLERPRRLQCFFHRMYSRQLVHRFHSLPLQFTLRKN